MNTGKRVYVVGAGITGCTIARLIADKGIDVTILERSSYLGGACRDGFESFGYKQHHGSHIFHTDDFEVYKFLSRFTEWLPYTHKVLGSIDGSLVPIPLNITSMRQLLSNEDFKQLMNLDLEYNADYTLEDFSHSGRELLRALGDYIFSTVFELYSQKQWGKIPDKSVLSRVKAYRHSKDDRYFRQPYQGIPFNGFSEMLRKMVNHVAIDLEYDAKVTLENLPKDATVFFTGPLDELFDYSLGELPYRTCEFSYKLCNGKTLPNAVVNYPTSFEMTRAHDYSYYMPDSAKAWVAYEYPKDFDRNNPKHHRYYPIKELANETLYEEYRRQLEDFNPNIIPAGRLGTYKYLDMDKAVRQAMDLVDEFLKK